MDLILHWALKNATCHLSPPNLLFIFLNKRIIMAKSTASKKSQQVSKTKSTLASFEKKSEEGQYLPYFASRCCCLLHCTQLEKQVKALEAKLKKLKGVVLVSPHCLLS
jgi:hypothetical protein